MLTNKIRDSDWLKPHEIHEADHIFHVGSLYHKCIYICACTKINLLIDVKCLQMSLNINLLATQALYRFIILVTENQLAVPKSKSESLIKIIGHSSFRVRSYDLICVRSLKNLFVHLWDLEFHFRWLEILHKISCLIALSLTI